MYIDSMRLLEQSEPLGVVSGCLLPGIVVSVENVAGFGLQHGVGYRSRAMRFHLFTGKFPES